MASAWGDSWGNSWGNSWGTTDTEPEVILGGNAGIDTHKTYKEEEDELLLLIHTFLFIMNRE